MSVFANSMTRGEKLWESLVRCETLLTCSTIQRASGQTCHELDLRALMLLAVVLLIFHPGGAEGSHVFLCRDHLS